MAISLVNVAEWGTAPTAELLTRAFEDYFVKIIVTQASLEAMVGIDSLSLTDSWVAFLDGEPAGASLIARRGRESRFAGMGLLPAARHRGVGRALVNHEMAQARERGDRRMLLECIAQNVPALGLYEKSGFRRMRPLYGYTLSPPPSPGDTAGEVQSVDLPSAGVALTRLNDDDWPWQISGETVRALPVPNVAYRDKTAWVVLTDPTQATVTIRGLGIEGADPDGRRGSRLLRSVMARYPSKAWRANAVWPEAQGGSFLEAGFTRTELSQWQMEVPL